MIDVNVIERNVPREHGPVRAQQRITLDSDNLALRTSICGRALAPTDEMRERVVDDRDFSARRPGVEKEILIAIDDLSDRPSGFRPLRERAVQIIQAEAAGLVARTHRIPRVVIDCLGPARERCPRPDAQILRRHGWTDVHRNCPEPSLQFTHPETVAPFVVREGSCEVEQGRAPRHVTIDECRVFGVEGCAVEIHFASHPPIV